MKNLNLQQLLQLKEQAKDKEFLYRIEGFIFAFLIANPLTHY